MIDLFADDPVDLLVSRVFKRSTIALDRVLAGEEIGYRQWLVLSQVDQEPGITAREIADRLRHDTGALSRIVEFLCDRGLIERERSTEDKRVVRLTPTDCGRTCSGRCRRKVAERRDHWRRQLSGPEQTALIVAMSKLAAAIEDER